MDEAEYSTRLANFGSTFAPPIIRFDKGRLSPQPAPLNAPPGHLRKDSHHQPQQAMLTTMQAAWWLGVSPRTLEDWRFRGGGPKFRKVGKRLVRYFEGDLEAFSEQCTMINTGGGRPDG